MYISMYIISYNIPTVFPNLQTHQGWNRSRPVLQETRAVPAATEAELRVRAVGLNFRDVLNVMGSSGGRSAVWETFSVEGGGI